MNIQTIQQVRQRIQTQGASYRQSEQQTRLALIDPILDALGWELWNPEHATLDQTQAGGRPDYTLLKNGKKQLFVEAKKLGVPLEKGNPSPLKQLSIYCNENGVDFGMITDGEKWILFSAYVPDTKIIDRILWRVDLSVESKLQETRLRLMQLSRTEVEKLNEVVQRHKKMEELCKDLWDKRDPVINQFAILISNEWMLRYPNEQLSDNDATDFAGIWLEELERKRQEQNGGGGGSEDNGEWPDFEFTPRTSKEVLTKIAEWVYKLGKLKVPIETGRRYLVNSEPKDPNGKSFHGGGFKLTEGIYLETTFSSKDCEAKARELLVYCGCPKSLMVDWEQVGNGWRPRKVKIG